MSSERPEWPTDPTSYELIGKIGQGAFASVWRAKCRDDDTRQCAIKVLNLDHVDSNLSEIRLEVQALRLSSHRNVLCCYTTFVHSTDLWLVTQLMRKGSSLHCLQSARRQLRRQKQKCIQMENHILYILHETLLGLQYIHDNGQIHRDIKAGNILLDGDGEVRIADFGVSGWLVNAGTQVQKAQTFVGTPCWMAPEVMEQVHGYDYKADIWSLGITALELAKGYAPYAKYPPMKVLILTIQEDPPSLDTYDEEEEGLVDLDYGEDENDEMEPETFSKSFSSLVDACLQKNPAKRPKSLELLQSKHLASLQDENVRQERRVALAQQVCALVDDVGENQDASGTSTTNTRNLPGNAPVSIVLSTDGTRRAGTTWVFADGSQVVASSKASNATVDDVMAELDQFGLQTGGEHYKNTKKQGADENSSSGQATPPASSRNKEEPDDLNAFMDEFELHTQGEDFRHPSKQPEN